MSKHPQSSNGHGSLLDIQLLVNDYPQLFFEKICNATKTNSKSIDWVSPQRNDELAEYRDDDFLDKLGITSLNLPLNEFWPKKGPQWDALGRGDKGDYFLVEAKANVREIVSPPTSASSQSLRRIKTSLASCKEYLKINNSSDWTGTFYQYTNRIAHLYFLRVLNKQPAFLIFVYFVGDESVSGPNSIVEWQAALAVLEGYLGLSTHRLKKYIAEVFVDVKEIGF